MPYEDGAFLRMSPAEIIRRVAASDPSLAMVSAWTVEEQVKAGWLHNPIIDILYSMTSAGVWIARTDASGQQKVIEASGSSISGQTLAHARYALTKIPASVNAVDYSTDNNEAACENRHRRIGMLAMTTDGSGNMAATAIVTGPAGYYPVVKLLGVWSPTIEASTEFDFTVTGGALVGPSRIDLALVAYGVTTIAPYGCPVYLYNLTDASAINIAIQGGNATTTHYLIYEYWYET